MKKILKKYVKKKLIHLVDFHFALFVSQKKEHFLMLIAAYTSYVTSIGHTCLPLNYNKNFIESINKKIFNKILKCTKCNLTQKLLQYNAISNGSSITPLVFSNNSLYLYKYWKAEQNIYNFFTKKIALKKINFKRYHVILESLFNNEKPHYIHKIAILISTLYKNSFIIGGPGTGKTTIISKIILFFIRISHKQPIKIKLAAPTGKAATRLKECLKYNLKKIKVNTIEKKLFPTQVVTLHHLLKISPITTNNKINTTLFLDVLIIDESSMIDTILMNELIKQLPKSAKLILVGDFNQLPSIESGNILKDICKNSNNIYSCNMKKILKSILTGKSLLTPYKKIFFNITDTICILKKNYRFTHKSDIHTFSQIILNNDKNNFKKLFNNSYKNIKFYEVSTTYSYIKMIKQIANNYINYWNYVHSNKPFKKIVHIFNKYRVLCVINEGNFGITGINKHIEHEMMQKNLIKKIQNEKNNFFIGQPIIITKSNRSLNILNGDIGIIMIDNNVLKAFFLLSNNYIHTIPVTLLAHYQTAWCMTIHKSQGSEFKKIDIILPNVYYTLLTKELLYTAITRSIKTINIYSNKNIFLKSVSKNIYRYSNLSKLIYSS